MTQQRSRQIAAYTKCTRLLTKIDVWSVYIADLREEIKEIFQKFRLISVIGILVNLSNARKLKNVVNDIGKILTSHG